MNNKESCIFVAWLISQCIYAGVSTWECLSGGKWLLYSTEHCITELELTKRRSRIGSQALKGSVNKHSVVGGIMNNKESCIFVAWFISQCIYAGVSTWNVLVVGNGSYIVRPCGHDLHGLDIPFSP